MAGEGGTGQMQRDRSPVIPGRSRGAAEGKGIQATSLMQRALHERLAWTPFPALTRRRG